MHRVTVWQHSSNWNIKVVHNSIEHFLWNPSDFSSDDVLSCLWIAFKNSVFQVLPSENSHVGWDLGNRMAKGYQFDAKWVCPMGSYAWGIQVFCSRNEVVPRLNKYFKSGTRLSKYFKSGTQKILAITGPYPFFLVFLKYKSKQYMTLE